MGLSISVLGQPPGNPLPSEIKTGQYYKWLNWGEFGKGVLLQSQDTTDKPISPAFRIWVQPGGDTSAWVWDTKRWKKLGGGSRIVDRIEDLELLDGRVEPQVFVKDTLAGGTFTAYSSVGQIVDTAITIRSSNPAFVYIRDMSQATAVDVRWWKPYTYLGKVYWDSAFNKTINYLSSKYNGGDIYIPKGTYLTKAPIFVKDNIHFHLDRNAYVHNVASGARSFVYGQAFCFGWFQQLDVADSSITNGTVRRKAEIYRLKDIPKGQRYIEVLHDSSMHNFEVGKVYFIMKNSYPMASGVGTVAAVGEASTSKWCQLRRVDSISLATRRVYLTEAIDDTVCAHCELRDSNYTVFATSLKGGYITQAPEFPSYIVQNASLEGGIIESDSSGALACRPASFQCRYKNVLILNSKYLLGSNGGHLCEWDNVSGYYGRRMMEDAEGGDHNKYMNFWAAQNKNVKASGGQAAFEGITEEPIMTLQDGDIVENFNIDNSKSNEGVCANFRANGTVRNGRFFGNFNNFVTVKGDNNTLDNCQFINVNDTLLNSIMKTGSSIRWGGLDQIEGNADDTIPISIRCNNTIISNCFFDSRITDSIHPIAIMFLDNSRIINNSFNLHNTGKAVMQINGQHNTITGNYYETNKATAWTFTSQNPTEFNYLPTDTLNNNYYNNNSTSVSNDRNMVGGIVTDFSFIGLTSANQPATPASGGRLFYNSDAFRIVGTNGFYTGFSFNANTANRSYTFPDISGQVLTGNSTAVVNNKDLTGGTNTFAIKDAGIASNAAIANSKLANSSITINGTSVPLGGSISVTGTAAPIPGVVMAADQSNTTSTYTDVTGMTLPVVAGTRYRVVVLLYTEQTGGVGGIKMRLNGPAGATFTAVFSGNSTSATATQGLVVSGFGSSVTASNRYTGTGWAQITGYISIGATAGNIQLQTGSINNGETTIVHAGSGMDLVQLTAAP